MKLLLVEDHLYVSESMQLLMERTVDFVTAPSVKKAIEIITKEENFDIVLLDIGLPDDRSGKYLLQFFQNHHYYPPVLVITGQDGNPDCVNTAKSLGAKGFYYKSQSPKILMEAIDTLLEGGEFWPTRIAAEILSSDEKIVNIAKQFGITPRQLEVLSFLEEGLQNKEIAEVMHISEGTVKSHIKSLYSGLGAHTRSGCVKTARQLGLIG